MPRCRYFGYGHLDLAGIASVEDDGSPVLRQAFGQSEPDALRRACNKGTFALRENSGKSMMTLSTPVKREVSERVIHYSVPTM